MQPQEKQKFEERAKKLGLNRYSRPRTDSAGMKLPESTWELLPDHIDQVATRSDRILGILGLGLAGSVIGRMHDLAKSDPRFYARLYGTVESFDHAALGGRLADIPSTGWFPQIILGHHRSIPDNKEQDGMGIMGADERMVAAALHRYDPTLVPTDTEIRKAAKEVQTYVRMALYSSFPDDVSRKRFESMLVFGMQKLIYSSLVDADYLGTEHFFRGEREKKYDPLSVIVDKLIAYRDQYAAKSSRAAKPYMINMRNDLWKSAVACGDMDGDLFTMTGPTGSGKTFAYMVLALKKAIRDGQDRVIVVLPFCAIISQVCDMLRSAIGEKNVLEHHSGYDLDEMVRSSKKYQRARSRTSSRNHLRVVRSDIEERIRESFENWDAPVIVTTREQFDESFFCRYPGRSRRIHNMANSVIVFDEVQTTPRALTAPFIGELHVLRSLYRSTLILSTATQPAYGRKPERLWGLSGAKEVVANAKRYFHEASQRVRMSPLGDIAVMDLALRIAKEHQAMCVCNTRKNSDLVSQALTRLGIRHILMNALIHKRQIRRMIREVRRRLDRDEHIILVTTQIVEAGVDLDFPNGYSEACPLDSRLQRAGRVNRHGNRPQGVMHVFTLADGNRNRGYDRANCVTESVISDCGDYSVEKLTTMDEYYRRLLREEKDNLDIHGIVPMTPNLLEGRGGLEVAMAPADRSRRVLRTKFSLYDKFKYIGGRVSIAIPVDRRCQKALSLIQDRILKGWRPGRKLLSILQDYVVSVYTHEFKELDNCADLEESHGFWILRDMSWYDKKRGLLIWNLPCYNK
jgi:CRISPR-associated endonuclease/helicase Cas3